MASVRFPTNLIELANLEEEFPGTIFLHTGFQAPREEAGDRGQFHSKLVLIERDQTQRCILIGSHNWTENALEGYNLEAGVVIHCQESDAIVAEAREHIDACARRSEPFSVKRLRFYQAVQCELHRGDGPGSVESEDFPGFKESDALVIHAEDGTPQGLPRPVQLFIPVRDEATEQLFREAPRVLLYLHPPGTLLGKRPASPSPAAYEGAVTMTNVVPDAPVRDRSANCRIDNLGAPRIDLLPAHTVPPTSGERSQVVIRFEPMGTGDLPVFHAAEQHPKMRLGVKYKTVDRDEGDELAEDRRKKLDSETKAGQVELLPEYEAPHHLTVRATLRVPSEDLYTYDIYQRLTYVLTGTDFFDETTVPELRLNPPALGKMLNRYVYRVHYRLSEATTARIETQLRLF